MDKYQLAYINKDYGDYLRRVDHRVSLKEGRPFLVLMISLNQKQYGIPFTSQFYRENGMRRNQRTTTEIKTATTEYGVLLHNNMIPLFNEVISYIDIEKEENNDLLRMENSIIRKDIDNIIRKANTVYNQRIANNDSFINSFCCDFEKLENASIEYCRINNIDASRNDILQSYIEEQTDTKNTNPILDYCKRKAPEQTPPATEIQK